jgi:hypothetical protein
MFTSPLLYHHSLPTVRTVTDPQTGRRYSVVDTGKRGAYPYPPRRNTIAVVSPRTATADNSPVVGGKPTNPDDPVLVFRQTSYESAPAYNKGGTMSKVVRSVKNVTKGYSSVQVKVRNGRSQLATVPDTMLRVIQRRQMIHGARRALTWRKLQP